MVDDLVTKLKDSLIHNRTYKQENIYLVGEGAIAKRIYWKQNAKKEYEWGEYLFKKEVSVPKVYNLINLNSSFFNEISSWSLMGKGWVILMQKIDGDEIINLSGINLKEATKQYKQELEKVLDLGIYPEEATWGGNSIFNYEKKKLYLIDFQRWHKGSKKKLEEYYKMIRNSKITFD